MGCRNSKFSSEKRNEGELVSNFKITALDLDSKLKGTITFAFYYKEGIMVGVDSRGSNEWRPEKPLRIEDDGTKMFVISNNIIAIMVGTRAECNKMKEDIMEKCSNIVKKGAPTISVSYVLQQVSTFLGRYCHQEEVYKFGTLIAGWDADQGLQIHRIYIKDRQVVKENHCAFESLGTGREYANNVAENIRGHCYETEHDYSMPVKDATELALKALFNATFYKKDCGGTLHVYRVNAAAGWKEICSLDPLEAYYKYYDLYDERNTLFLVVSSSSHVPRVSSDDLIAQFRAHGNAIAAHRVAHRQLGKHGFYFHRLVFGSEDEASRVYEQTTPHGITSPAILKKFPNRVVLATKDPNATLNMNRSSKGLLKFILESCSKPTSNS